MESNGGERSVSRLTARGAATRVRIVAAAAELMYVKGVEATTLAEILNFGAASKSQFRQHFSDKDELIRAVIALRAREVLEDQTRRLARVESIQGLERWCDAFMRRSLLRRGAWGCELGSLSSELSDRDEDARRHLHDVFKQWSTLLEEAFIRMRDNGSLTDDIDAAVMATSVLAAVQGGYMLAQVAHDAAPMKSALNMALNHVRSHEARH